jgi:orotidine-5'-phosphate decarboxylase
MEVLKSLITYAREQDYYVLMDLPELLTPNAAASAVKAVADFDCDGVVAGCYLGSDVLTPLSQLCRDGKSVFGVCRTANRSAVELQDLLTGGRHSHTAAADVIFRFAEPVMAKCGYSQLGIVAGASSAQSLKTLRSKFPKLFLLLDGYDYPNANAKNCENAFDRLGHGAAACASSSIAAAWMIAEEGGDYVQQAIEAAQRMKKNLTRYVTIL